MYLTGSSYEAAMARLSSIFGEEPVKRAALKKIDSELEDKNNSLLLPDESKWPELFARLKAMNIHENVIEVAKTSSEIAANSEGHIVFTKNISDEDGNQRNSGTLVVDIQFPDVTVMETSEDDTFSIIDMNAKHTVICSSPLDALAIKSQDEHRDANVISIGKNPGEFTKKTLQFFAEAYPNKIFFAENLLDAGRKLAAWLSEQIGQVINKIPLPENFRSWIGFQIASRTEISPMKETPINEPENVSDPELPAME